MQNPVMKKVILPTKHISIIIQTFADYLWSSSDQFYSSFPQKQSNQDESKYRLCLDQLRVIIKQNEMKPCTYFIEYAVWYRVSLATFQAKMKKNLPKTNQLGDTKLLNNV